MLLYHLCTALDAGMAISRCCSLVGWGIDLRASRSLQEARAMGSNNRKRGGRTSNRRNSAMKKTVNDLEKFVSELPSQNQGEQKEKAEADHADESYKPLFENCLRQDACAGNGKNEVKKFRQEDLNKPEHPAALIVRLFNWAKTLDQDGRDRKGNVCVAAAQKNKKVYVAINRHTHELPPGKSCFERIDQLDPSVLNSNNEFWNTVRTELDNSQTFTVKQAKEAVEEI